MFGLKESLNLSQLVRTNSFLNIARSVKLYKTLKYSSSKNNTVTSLPVSIARHLLGKRVVPYVLFCAEFLLR